MAALTQGVSFLGQISPVCKPQKISQALHHLFEQIC